jgi:hypothetical protein
LYGLRQNGTTGAREPHRWAKYGRGKPFFQKPAHGALRWRTRNALLDDPAADVDQTAIVDTGRAGGFTVSASQTSIEVLLRLAGWGVPFQHLLDQVNASARAIELVAQQLVRGAGCQAKTAVHAFAKNLLGLCAFTSAPKFRA